MANCMLEVLLTAALLLAFCSFSQAAATQTKNSSITLSQLENSDFFAPVSADSSQRPDRQTSNVQFLPGLQRVPLSFQGFLDSSNEGAVGGVGSLTNGLDLETYTKNQAIRANQENAIVAQLSNMASVRKNQLARDISGGNMSVTNQLVSNLMRDLAVSPAGNMAFPSYADRASALSSENFGSQSSQQQQLMLARLLAEEQQRLNGQQQPVDLTRMLQLQALNGNNPGVFNQLSAAQLLQQQQMRPQINGNQQLFQQQQPSNPFLAPPPSMLSANNPIGMSNLPLQMQQLNNERLLRNQLLLSSLNQQQQLLHQQQPFGGSSLNTNSQQAVNSLLSRPSASDLTSTPSPKSPVSSLFQDNKIFKLANTKMNIRDLDVSSPFFPSESGSGLFGNSGGHATTRLEQTNEGFVDEVADGFGRKMPGQLKDSALVTKNETKRGIH